MQQSTPMQPTPARTPSSAVRLFRNIVKSRTLLLLMVPGLVALLINQYLPIFGVIIAFKNVNYKDGILFSPWAGLSNFDFLFANSAIWVALRNTVVYNLVFIFSGLIASVAIAILLNEVRRKRMAKLYHSIIIMPGFLSIIIVAFVVLIFLSFNDGVMNKIVLPVFGVDPIDWYKSPEYWYFILPIVNLWKGAGMGSILYLSTIYGFDNDYYEAAVIDGAKKYQQIWYITIPMLLPMMSILTILSLGGIVRADFGLFYQVPQDSAMLYPATDVIDTIVYRSLITLHDFGMSSAAGFFQSVIGCVLIIIVNLIVKKMDDNYSIF